MIVFQVSTPWQTYLRTHTQQTNGVKTHSLRELIEKKPWALPLLYNRNRFPTGLKSVWFSKDSRTFVMCTQICCMFTADADAEARNVIRKCIPAECLCINIEECNERFFRS